MMDEVNDDMEEAIFATERITKKTEELVKAAGYVTKFYSFI